MAPRSLDVSSFVTRVDVIGSFMSAPSAVTRRAPTASSRDRCKSGARRRAGSLAIEIRSGFDVFLMRRRRIPPHVARGVC